MALSSGFFNSRGGDRTYTAEQFSELFNGIIYDGVFKTYGEAFIMTADTNCVIIGSGKAWLKGKWIVNNSKYTLTIPSSDPIYYIRGNIVINVDNTNRKVTFEAVSSPPATNPSYPVAGDNQLVIGQFTLTPGARKAFIDYKCGSSICPWVTYVLEQNKMDELDQLMEQKADTVVSDMVSNPNVLLSNFKRYAIPMADYTNSEIYMFAYPIQYANSDGSIQNIRLTCGVDFFEGDTFTVEHSKNGTSSLIYTTQQAPTSSTSSYAPQNMSSSYPGTKTITCTGLSYIDFNTVNCNTIKLKSKSVSLVYLANNIGNEEFTANAITAWMNAHPEATTTVADGSITEAKLSSDYKNNLWKKMYPVGSIYMSVNSSSPASLFGGSWTRLIDTFLLAAGNKYTAGSTGGEATHMLTIDEMPAHNHSMAQSGYSALTTNASSAFQFGDMSSQSGTGRRYLWSASTFDVVRRAETGNSGGTNAHNNMPPYLAVYMWKRVS